TEDIVGRFAVAARRLASALGRQPRCLAGRAEGVRPHRIGGTAMPSLSISSEKVCFLIVKAREFDVQDVDTELEDGSNPGDDRMIDVLEESRDNPVQQELRTFIAELDEDEKADLIGLMRLGRGDGTMEEWQALRDE